MSAMMRSVNSQNLLGTVYWIGLRKLWSSLRRMKMENRLRRNERHILLMNSIYCSPTPTHEGSQKNHGKVVWGLRFEESRKSEVREVCSKIGSVRFSSTNQRCKKLRLSREKQPPWTQLKGWWCLSERWIQGYSQTMSWGRYCAAKMEFSVWMKIPCPFASVENCDINNWNHWFSSIPIYSSIRPRNTSVCC